MPNELFDQMEAEVKEAEAELDKAETDVAVAPAEESEEAVEAETEAPVEAEEESETKQKMVPLPALHEERKRRQALEAELKERDEKYARLDERLKLLDEKMRPKEPEIPAYEEDPFEHLRQKLTKEEQERGDITKRLSEFEEHQKQQQAQALLHQSVVAAENEFRNEHPDYDEAVNHLKSARAKEYNAMGITDPGQIQQMLSQEAVQLAQMALHNNKSPAQMAYDIAVSRGYAQKATAEDKLANIEKGQKKSTSLSGTGGGEERVLDIEALANMSDADFAKAMEDGLWGKVVSSI